MRDYGVITPGFWIGETGRKLRGDHEAQVVALYLCSNPHANMIGLYYLPISYLSNDIGSPSEGASKALRRVCEAGFAIYDEASETVFVPAMAKFQVAEHLQPNDKRRHAVEKELEKWRKHRFALNFYELYAERFSLTIERPTQAPSKALASPSEAPSKALRSQDQDQDQDQEQKKKRRTQPDPGANAPAPPVVVPPSIDPPDPIPYTAIVESYNAEIATGTRWSRCVRLTDQLRKTIRARWHDAGGTLDAIRDVFRIVRASDFLVSIKSGSTDISWVLGPKNFSDLLNGKYAPSAPTLPGGRLASREPTAEEADAELEGLAPEVRAWVISQRQAASSVPADSEGIPY